MKIHAIARTGLWLMLMGGQATAAGLTTETIVVNGTTIQSTVVGVNSAGAIAPGQVVVDANGNDATGAGATGVSQPSGGAGILGWLSGLYSKLSGTLSVTMAGAIPAGNNVIGIVRNPSPAITPTSVSVGGSSTTVLAAGAATTRLDIINSGGANVWLTPIGGSIATAAVGTGVLLLANGGSFTFAGAAPSNAFAAIAVSGSSTLTVWAGN